MGSLFLLMPLCVFADTTPTAAIGAAFPSDGTAGTGTRVSFSLITSGFVNPTYKLVDSFGGGANTNNLDSQGNFVWVPNYNDIGGHTMTVTVSDSQGNSATASYSVTVVAPAVTVSSVSASTLQYGSQMSFTIGSQGFISPSYAVDDSFYNSSVASYNTTGTTFYWTPQLKDVGVHTLLVTARDNSGRYASTSQMVTVLGPASVSASAVTPGTTVGVGQAFSFVATSTGLGSPIFGVVDQFYNPATTTFTQSGANISWKPVYNDVGVHVFSISATSSDGSARSATGSLSVTVVPYATSNTPTMAVVPSVAPAATVTTSVATAPVASGSGYVFKTYLAVGSSGAAVTELQKKLIALGLLNSAATGYFGALTKKAVQDFQKTKGLSAVGYVGPGTRAALNTK